MGVDFGVWTSRTPGMGIEIERKFLVRNDGWRTEHGTRLIQGYLSRDKGRTVRVRIAGEAAWLTIKGLTTGISRAEFEYAIPVADAEQLLSLCEGPIIEKTRHLVEYEGTTWEVDEFHGANAGLVVAEVELDSESEFFARPAWLGDEVSGDVRYSNSSLSVMPFSLWPK